MRLTPLAKGLIAVVVLAAAGTAGYMYFAKGGSTQSCKGLLGRPLRVGVVTWPGYAGGIVANNGFAPNKECIYWNGHKLLVQIMLMEDTDVLNKAFARGGDDGVDIVWSTVDYWANELPGFKKSGVDAKA